ncbi:penicillin-binding transpeptidase domain-containing protein [Tissierella creatinophila]|uniref:Beta-lactam-inducible penicillin-binding protein n=1 Tax=Tissierella creatinophila DSM 6911 TaxID=1123403 RepID=A0A1U7M798_TISCR|nr:penicillin-binding transpeptidase domain-containing protein [Tissierella creatinophila]OLS03155.1 beta-lactam-inducible penicillin-binding protein [Tissierella creatinophila DSM 6911]
MKKYKILTIFMIAIISIFTFTACSKETVKDSFNIYKTALEDKDYKKMYTMLSSSSKEVIKEEDFIERYNKIYEGIDAKNIKVDVKENEEEKETVNFIVQMDTLAGKISIDNYKAKMVKEKREDKKGWFIEWDESLIFPGMSKDDKVKVKVLPAKRGEIYDRDGKGLAVNGKRYSVGIYPAVYDKSSNPVLANLLDIDEEIIDKKLEKNMDPEQFIPIVKLALEDKEKLAQVLEIEGVRYYEVEDRVYPGGEALGSLVGYLKPITADRLKEDKEGIYHNTSLVGKAGLESVYENTLLAKDGKEIYISKIEDEKEVEKKVLAKIEPKNGEDLYTTIDTELQKKIYSEMNGDIGTSTAIDPKTGEVLSMVSSPSFDSNLYTTYIPNSQRRKWEDMDISVFENRFNKAYSPGSTFKIVTATIGLEKGAINPLEKINIQGKSWQKDSSWGGYKINRVSQKLSSVDLNNAFVYSDNIYFAKSALKIGTKDFIAGSKKFGFGEELPIKYPFAKSQIANEEKIGDEILLADTGYGQGQVLMSPLHLSLVYSNLVNDGNIMEPVLEKKEGEEPKIWKENIVTEENRTIVLNSLINVIEDKDGTAHEAKLPGIKLAGKTGTAELKLSQKDKGQENGWFVVMNVDNPKIVISMMIEGVEGRGGSHYVVPKVRNIMEYYLKDK